MEIVKFINKSILVIKSVHPSNIECMKESWLPNFKPWNTQIAHCDFKMTKMMEIKRNIKTTSTKLGLFSCKKQLKKITTIDAPNTPFPHQKLNQISTNVRTSISKQSSYDHMKGNSHTLKKWNVIIGM